MSKKLKNSVEVEFKGFRVDCTHEKCVKWGKNPKCFRHKMEIDHFGFIRLFCTNYLEKT
jgi:hypothetical protein